jgi:hypothetical protein
LQDSVLTGSHSLSDLIIIATLFLYPYLEVYHNGYLDKNDFFAHFATSCPPRLPDGQWRFLSPPNKLAGRRGAVKDIL